jgi:hypothetical protein
MAVGEVHALKKPNIRSPKINFLLIIVEKNLIHILIQLKVELIKPIFISKLN